MRAIILAGGKGVRLAPLTDVIPKPLVPIGGMPVMEIVIRQLKANGFRHITLAVGYLSELIKAYFQDGSRWGVKIDYSFEAEPLGTAGPLGLIDWAYVGIATGIFLAAFEIVKAGKRMRVKRKLPSPSIYTP